ncbi:MAG: elongation factor P [Candidatus Omnitrophica bacterium]|nr:elongation factor P [Candidatus Omnitrophota bacterium]
MVGINELKSGLVIRLENKLFTVIGCDHVKPGKGAAFVRTRLKNLETGSVLDRTFRASDKLEDIYIEEKTLQYLYADDTTLHFMDVETYEQQTIPRSIVGDGINFLKENMEITAVYHEHRLLTVALPITVNLVITETDPGLKGDTAKAGNKPAVLETGGTVQVPLFVQSGDKIKIDTRTGSYIERVSS